jgi:hypothetical protein
MLIDAEREYLRSFRALVRPAVGDASPGGPEVAADEQGAITAELDRRYPNYPRVASLPNLTELNIRAVAGELRAEAANPAAVAGRAGPARPDVSAVGRGAPRRVRIARLRACAPPTGLPAAPGASW